jgi:hypothetical protein
MDARDLPASGQTHQNRRDTEKSYPHKVAQIAADFLKKDFWRWHRTMEVKQPYRLQFALMEQNLRSSAAIRGLFFCFLMRFPE